MSYWDDSDRIVVRRCLDIIAERRLAYHEVQKEAEVRFVFKDPRVAMRA